MTLYSTLVDALHAARDNNHTGIRLINGDENEVFITYKSLYEQALLALFYLQRHGLSKGDELIIQLEDDAKFLCIFHACQLGGIVPVPLAIGYSEEHKAKAVKVFQLLKRPYYLADQEAYDRTLKFIDKQFPESFELFQSRSLLADWGHVTVNGEIESADPQDPALIQFSSGSTGEPKGVVLTHENLIANTFAIAHAIQLTPEDSYMNWMPLTHDMGLIGFHLVAFVSQVNFNTLPTSLFIRRPVLWLKKSYEHGATILGCPNFGYKYFLMRFKDEMASDWDLSKIRIIINGAEPVSVEICNAFLDRMQLFGLQRSAMYPCYGLAEASVGAVFPLPGEIFQYVCLDRRSIGPGQRVEPLENASSPHAVFFVDEGYAIQDCAMRICNLESNEVAPDWTVGQIQIKGKNVTSGYYNNPEATGNVLTQDGWLSTGDLGFIRNGRLVVTGRIKDIIFIDGQNYYSHDLEQCVHGIEEMELGKVAACGVYNEQLHRDDIVFFVLYKGELQDFIPIVHAIKKQVALAMGLTVKDVVPVRKIPKTTSGKFQRFQLAADYKKEDFVLLSDRLKELLERAAHPSNNNELTASDTEKTILTLGRNLFNPILGLHDNFVELGMDSKVIVQFHAELEEVFPHALTVASIFSNPTVSKLAYYIDHGGKIILPQCPLPDDYFVSIPQRAVAATLEVGLNEEFVGSLLQIQSEEHVELMDILTATFLLTFKEISRQSAIAVQTTTSRTNQLVTITVNFENTNFLDKLMKQIHVIRNQENETLVYDVRDIGQIDRSRESNAIIPLIYKKENIKVPARFIDIFDLSVEVRDSGPGLMLTCEYKSNRLHKNHVKHFLTMYIQILTSLLQQYVAAR